MRLLLDTHAFLWFVLDDLRLSGLARSFIEDPAHEILISPATYWELAIKIRTNKYSLPGPFEPFLGGQLATNDFHILPVEIRHTAVLTTLPLHHRDPFDRLIIAQAMAEDIPVVSGDAAFPNYPVRLIS